MNSNLACMRTLKNRVPKVGDKTLNFVSVIAQLERATEEFYSRENDRKTAFSDQKLPEDKLKEISFQEKAALLIVASSKMAELNSIASSIGSSGHDNSEFKLLISGIQQVMDNCTRPAY